MFELMLIVLLLIGGLLGGGVLSFATGIPELGIPFMLIGGFLGVAFASVCVERSNRRAKKRL